MEDYYPVINEEELETDSRPKCIICGAPAMKFIAEDVVLCSYCACDESK